MYKKRVAYIYEVIQFGVLSNPPQITARQLTVNADVGSKYVLAFSSFFEMCSILPSCTLK